MLLSELEERERRFKLALRAGIPIVLLLSLVFYATFIRNENLSFNVETALLFGSLVFITVYFIYFLMELSVKESLIDQTTQGFNQHTFVRKLQKYQPKTLALLIVNNLSTINENYSTASVDRMLFEIIHLLDNELRTHGMKRALIARRYGAEFLIAIDSESPQIESTFKMFTQKYRTVNNIEVDYAFAIITNIGDDLEQDIVRLKDIINTQHKTDIVQDSKKLSKTEEAVLKALEKKQFSLLFRPLLNTRTQRVDIYEISVQLQSDTLGKILPKVFLPIINRLGKGRIYDMALFEHILQLIPLVGHHVCFSFNLSPFSLRDKMFQEQFFLKLKESGVDPSRIIIELYERKTHHDLSGYLETLNRFRSEGVRIAIDNFGSSNASMEYMKHFHFDIVQFDRDYVTKLDESNTEAMLRSLVQMANDLGIITVAKWVDKPEQKEKLTQMGIQYLQGFGIAKAINEDTLIRQYN
jgi:EAL domain-containing protein (putative c-di-GMP-specific phosphodiesterase class I)/GGDEF domain-containing protein